MFTRHRQHWIIAVLSCWVVLCVSPVSAADIMVMGLFKNMAIIKVDDTRRKLRVGETSPEGISLISSDSEQAVLEIDGKQQVFTLGSFQSMSVSSTQREISEAKIYSDRGMFHTTGLINGQPVGMLVDTGASTVAMGVEHAGRLGINFRYIGKSALASTANGVVKTWRFKLKTVKVGDIEVSNVDASVIEGAGPSTILLGMSFLKHVKMQREGNLLQLQQKH